MISEQVGGGGEQSGRSKTEQGKAKAEARSLTKTPSSKLFHTINHPILLRLVFFVGLGPAVLRPPAPSMGSGLLNETLVLNGRPASGLYL